MNYQIMASMALVLLLMGCKEKKEETTQPTVPVAEETVSASGRPVTECYSVNKSGNVIAMEINYEKGKVSGTLTYALKEKDANKGTFVGQIRDSILVADYTFESEGTTSRRQIAYKFKGNKIVEGYGDMNADGTTFKDVSTLNFDSKMPLEKVPCSE